MKYSNPAGEKKYSNSADEKKNGNFSVEKKYSNPADEKKYNNFSIEKKYNNPSTEMKNNNSTAKKSQELMIEVNVVPKGERDPEQDICFSQERLQEAIIWSEILDKPMCKRRKRR